MPALQFCCVEWRSIFESYQDIWRKCIKTTNSQLGIFFILAYNTGKIRINRFILKGETE